MKLFLTSAGLYNKKITEEFLKLTEKKPENIKVIMVPTASRTAEEWKWVEVSKKQLYDIGIKTVDVLELDHKTDYSEVKNYDVLYMCGGNTFFIMHKIRETGFDKVIKEFVKANKLYFGVSAGSVLMGTTIAVSGLGAAADKNDIKLKDLSGLKYYSKAIVPHFQRKDKSLCEKFAKENNIEVLGLTDDQVLIITDKITLI